MTMQEVESVLGPGDSPDHGAAKPPEIPAGAELMHWSAGIKDILHHFR